MHAELFPADPVLEVFGNGVQIDNFDRSPSLTDGTDFGTNAVGTGADFQFTLRNPGSEPMIIQKISVSSTSVDWFSLSSPSSETFIAIAGSSEIIVTFTVNPSALVQSLSLRGTIQIALSSWKVFEFDVSTILSACAGCGVYLDQPFSSEPGAGDNTDYMGFSVATDGKFLAAGAPNDDGLVDAYLQNKGVVYLYEWDDASSSWSYAQRVSASDASQDDSFGNYPGSVSLYGDVLAVGCPKDDTPSSNSGSVRVFHRDSVSSEWTEAAILSGSDVTSNSYFGSAVAVYNGTIVVGTASRNNAYVFSYDGAAWQFDVKLSGSVASSSDRFGYSVALYGDTMLIGAPYTDTGGTADTGCAYVFVRSGGGAWSEQQRLTGSAAVTHSDRMGESVSLYGDVAVVSSHLDDWYIAPTTYTDAGCVYVFERAGTEWRETQRLTAASPSISAYFGKGLAIWGDNIVVGEYAKSSSSGGYVVFHRDVDRGWTQTESMASGYSGSQLGYSLALYQTRAVFGAPTADFFGTDAGFVYVSLISETLESHSGVYEWAITSPEERPSDVCDSSCDFGEYGVDLYGDAAVVAAPRRDGFSGATDAGAAIVYRKSSSGLTWELEAVLTASDESASIYFSGDGEAVSIYDDMILVGAYKGRNDANVQSGAAYVFTYDGSTWSQQAKLLKDGGGSNNDYFGHSVSLYDGTAVVGSYGTDASGGSDSGAVYVFTYDSVGDAWSSSTELVPSASLASDLFGWSVDIHADTIVIGAPYNDDSNSNCGAAYVFSRSNNASPSCADGL